MPRSARYPHMEKQGRVWYARLDVPRDLRHHFADDQHPAGRRVLAKSTGEKDAAKAHAIAQPILNVWKARFAELRSGGKTATQVKGEQLARKYARAKTLDPDEAEYIKLVEVFDFAARELVGASVRGWQDRLAEYRSRSSSSPSLNPGGHRRRGTGRGNYRQSYTFPGEDTGLPSGTGGRLRSEDNLRLQPRCRSLRRNVSEPHRRGVRAAACAGFHQ